jgi:hypothetical protein
VRLVGAKAMFAGLLCVYSFPTAVIICNLVQIMAQTAGALRCIMQCRIQTIHYEYTIAQETRKADAWMGDTLFQAGLARQPRRAPELQELTDDWKRQQDHFPRAVSAPVIETFSAHYHQQLLPSV